MFDLTGQLAVVTGARRGIGLAFAEALGELGRPVDIHVNNAGMIERAPAAEHPDAAWDRVLAVNLDAPFLLAREVGARMVRRQRL
jgi:2-deoxy-D-gluconate 3-dehydrogenase